jgi:hypothetical protein
LAGREERQYSQRDIKEAELATANPLQSWRGASKIKAASQGDILPFEVRLLKAVI